MGFTIVELLTVMSIIVILIGLLVPALNMAKRYAKDVKQRAQFHGIDVALQLFSSEFEGYPDSDYLDEDNKQYPGATRLCEAMVGQDLLGFHPASRFMADCTDGAASPTRLYDNPPGFLGSPTLDNLQARRGPYLQLENANAYRLEDIYEAGLLAGGGFDYPELFVLCDEYARVKNKSTGRRIGMPILYYKANTSGFRHDANSLPIPTDDKGQIYNYLDNHYLVGLGTPPDGATAHLLYAEPERFYESTRNERITITDGRPYRSDSYILISAGFDGLYGTRDDIFNFEP
jgi:type II secretory pathway pseudopilin PulG